MNYINRFQRDYTPANPNGRAAAAASSPQVLSNEDKAVLDSIDAKLSAAPTGAATSANQTTEIAALSAILTKIIAAPATEAKQDTTNTEIGATNETAAVTDTSTSGVNGLLKRIAQRLTSILTALGSPFQAGGSIGNTAFGVNNASGASAVNIQDGGNSITVDGTITANAGTNLNTSALALETTQSAGNTLTGAVTETAPANDTASSGLNGRLQRIAQRITTLTTDFTAGTYKMIIRGGAKGSTTAGDITSTAASADRQLMDVILRDASGTALAVGGGTQYNEGANTDPAIGTSVWARVVVSDPSYSDGSMHMLRIGQDGRLEIRASSITNKDSRGSHNVMTITALNSLANSQTVGWQSDKVVVGTALDFLIGIKLTMANTAPANDKSVYVYVCPFYYDGTTYYAASQGTTTLPTGSQGASTIASPNNLRLLGVLSYTTQNMVLQDTFLLSNCFGNKMPDAWSIIIIDFSGAAISASGNVVDYKTINQLNS